MKSTTELAFGLRIIRRIIIMIIICCWETPNTVAAEARVTIIRRYKSNDHKSNDASLKALLVPDKFVLHNSSCTQPLPYHYHKPNDQSLVTSSTPQCECVCDKQQPTIRYVNHKWSCVRDDFAYQLCNLRIDNNQENGIVLMKINSWEYIRLWTTASWTCKVDWSTSGVLQCNNTITTIKTPPDIRILITSGQYWIHVHTITKEVEGRIMKLGIRCDDGSSPKTHCLMLKVAGEINCPIIPLIPTTTTSIPTNTLLSPTVNDESTQASTETTTRRGSSETEQEAGGDSSVPIIPIAGGVAAVLGFTVILAVFLFYRRKHQRTIGRSSLQAGAQQQQAEHRLSEDVYYSNIKSPAPNVERVHASAPAYEKVLDQESNQDVPIDGGVEAVATLSHSNQEYDCIWTGAEDNQPLQKENTEQLGSEYYDYARADGPPDNGGAQDGMYDVPECEVGTVRPLPGQNYYEEAGAVIQGEETGEAADQERQDTTDDVTANPLYSFAFTGGSENSHN